MADVKTRFILDYGNYSSGIRDIQKQVDGFMSKNLSLNGILSQGAKALGGLGAAFSAGAVATSAWNKLLENSQTIGDAFNNSVTTANTTINTFFSSIASGDFSPFTDGLDSVITKAREAAEQMDKLGNIKISTDLINADADAKITKARAVLKDNSASDDLKQQAREIIAEAVSEKKKALEYRKAETIKAIATNLATDSGVNASDITMEMIDKALKLQGSTEGAQRLEWIKKATQAPEMPKIYSTMPADVVNAAYKKYNEAYSEYRINNAQLTPQDYVSLAANEKRSDEALQSLVSLRKEVFDLEKELGNTILKATKALDTTTEDANKGTTHTTTNHTTATQSQITLNAQGGVVPQLGDIKKKLSGYIKLRDVVTSQEQSQEIETMIGFLQTQIDAHPLMLKFNTPSADEAKSMQFAESMSSVGMVTMDMSGLKPLEMPKGADKSVDGIVDGAKKARDAWSAAATAISNVGGALSSVGNKGLNIAGTIMQAVANVALSFSSALAKPESQAGGIFGWIAAGAAGIASMVTLITTIKHQTSGSFAEGGVVPGVYNGGADNTYIYASPGEVILNRAQQNNIVSQLTGGDNGGTMRESYVRAETIYIGLHNYLRRTGKRL